MKKNVSYQMPITPGPYKKHLVARTGTAAGGETQRSPVEAAVHTGASENSQ